MQGNRVLTGNIIILTHDRPIHKTNAGYLGPLGEQRATDSNQTYSLLGPGGSGCCQGEGHSLWQLRPACSGQCVKERERGGWILARSTSPEHSVLCLVTTVLVAQTHTLGRDQLDAKFHPLGNLCLHQSSLVTVE